MQRLLRSLLIVTAGVIGLSAFAAPLEAGGGGHGGCIEQPREGANQPVEITNSCFTPAVLYVEPGTTVTWTNKDEMVHNVTFLDGNRAGDDPELYYRNSVSHTFDTPGLYAYYCSIHPSMLGVVAVGDPSAFAVSQPAQQPDPSAAATVTASSGSALSPSIAGLILGVGLVSAGGGYLLRRRAP